MHLSIVKKKLYFNHKMKTKQTNKMPKKIPKNKPQCGNSYHPPPEQKNHGKRQQLIPIAHKYMTTHFPGVIWTL